MAEQWFVVEAKSTRELEAHHRILEQGFESFLPLETRRYHHAHKISERQLPYFPRYLFARFDVRVHGWQAIHNTRGVKCLLGSPTPVADAIIHSIQERLANVASLQAGDFIQIHGGIWHGQKGLFSEDQGQRVKVLLSMLGQAVEISVERRFVDRYVSRETPTSLTKNAKNGRRNKSSVI